jgi:hypothetical protein
MSDEVSEGSRRMSLRIGAYAHIIVPVLAAALSGLGWPQPAQLAPERAVSSWSNPVRISDPGKPTWFALLAATDDGALHAVWGQNDAADPVLDASLDTIYYSTKRDAGWSAPADIFVAPANNQAVLSGLRADQNGRLHILWLSRPGIVYGTALASDASSSRAWRTSRIGEDAQAAGLAVDTSGAIHIVYVVSGKGIYHIRSDDGGHSWSAPHTVWATPDEHHTSGTVNIEVDGGGAVHVVWVVNSAYSNWGGVSINYARSLDGGRTWEQCLVVGEADNQPNLAFDGFGGLHLLWNNPVGTKPGRGHAWSGDGGGTWGPVERLLPGYSGLTLAPSMAADSAGALHAVTAAQTPDGVSTRVFHSVWLDGKWADFDLVSASRPNSEAPALAISGGNRLNVVWHCSSSDNPYDYGIWYATALIDAPAVAPRRLPAAAPTTVTPNTKPTTSTVTPMAIATSMLQSNSQATDGANAIVSGANDLVPYVAGTLPPVVVIGLYLALRLGRQPR